MVSLNNGFSHWTPELSIAFHGFRYF